MPRKYQKLAKRNRRIPPQSFYHIIQRFGFTTRQIVCFWQSEIVQMAYRNYINGYIDLDYFYVILYEWIENNKFEYGRKQYKIFVYGVIRDGSQPKKGKTPGIHGKSFLYSKMNNV